MFTKKKSPQGDSDTGAEGDDAQDAPKAKPKAKKKKRKSLKPLAAGLYKNILPALPVLLLLALIGLMLQLAWQVDQSGKIEGNIAYQSGRYIVLDTQSDEIKGNLLPPIHSVPTSLIPNQQPDATNPQLDIPTIALPEDDVKLATAPNMALIEQVEGKLLPKTSADGVAPWSYYARPHTKIQGTNQISVIITGLGMHNDLSLAAAKLPPAISFSISPYAPNAAAWVKSMRVQGHECLMDLPVELDDYPLTDPGPSALQPSIMPAENSKRLVDLLSKAVGYIGFVVPMDEVFFEAQQDFTQPIIKELSERGISLIFSQAKAQPALKEIMDAEDLVYLDSHVFIRYGSDATAIRQELSAAEAIAQQRGHALIIVEASPIVVEELLRWSEKLRSNGFQLAPASALAKDEFS